MINILGKNKTKTGFKIFKKHVFEIFEGEPADSDYNMYVENKRLLNKNLRQLH